MVCGILCKIAKGIKDSVMLNESDKELTRRGHKFVRYADDCMILQSTDE